jgi:hypothetical protein
MSPGMPGRLAVLLSGRYAWLVGFILAASLLMMCVAAAFCLVAQIGDGVLRQEAAGAVLSLVVAIVVLIAVITYREARVTPNLVHMVSDAGAEQDHQRVRQAFSEQDAATKSWEGGVT